MTTSSFCWHTWFAQTARFHAALSRATHTLTTWTLSKTQKKMCRMISASIWQTIWFHSQMMHSVVCTFRPPKQNHSPIAFKLWNLMHTFRYCPQHQICHPPNLPNLVKYFYRFDKKTFVKNVYKLIRFFIQCWTDRTSLSPPSRRIGSSRK